MTLFRERNAVGLHDEAASSQRLSRANTCSTRSSTSRDSATPHASIAAVARVSSMAFRPCGRAPPSPVTDAVAIEQAYALYFPSPPRLMPRLTPPFITISRALFSPPYALFRNRAWPRRAARRRARIASTQFCHHGRAYLSHFPA